MYKTIVSAGHPLPDNAGTPFQERPANPRMLEGVNVWFFEENGDFAVPRIALDAYAESWDSRWTGANFVLPDGRVADGKGSGYSAISNKDEHGNPSIFGCSVMQFRCHEAFRRWHLSYEDDVMAGALSDQIALANNPAQKPTQSGEKVRIRLDVDLTLLPPPWAQVFPENAPLEFSFLGIGGWRYESHCTVEGTLDIDGKARKFKGVGNFIHRQNLRTLPHELPGWHGHVWQAAHFPDGRSFALNVYPEVTGVQNFNMAYLYQNGKIYNGKVVEAPWLKELQAEGEDCSVVIETELGLTRIQGRTFLSMFHPMAGMRLQQGGARYTWDNQTAIGMIERSL